MALSHLDVLVVAIFLLCVLVVVVDVLRGGPSVFGRFIRGFGGLNIESGAENQGQVKHVNWKKGFFRLTLVLSIPLGLYGVAGLIDGILSNSWDAFFIGFVSFGLIWLVYFLIGPAIIKAIVFVMRGFIDKN